ncbi:MAG: hypothetical protein ACOC4M_18085, partial [Promethearchaeia archaeon]
MTGEGRILETVKERAPFMFGALLCILTVFLHEIGHILAICLCIGPEAVRSVRFSSVKFAINSTTPVAAELFIYSAGVMFVLFLGYCFSVLFYFIHERTGFLRDISFLLCSCFLFIGSASVFEDFFIFHGDMYYIYHHLDSAVPMFFFCVGFINFILLVKAVRLYNP